MPSIRVNIAPKVLNWILSVASSEGVDDEFFSCCYQWKNAEKIPTFAKIEDLSKKAHIPLGYFFLKTPPEEPLPLIEYRTIKSAVNPIPSRDLMDTYYQMSAIQTWMRDYLMEAGNDKLPFVGSCKDEKYPAKIAASIRSVIGMATDWYTDSRDRTTSFNILRDFFENIGIIILQNGIVGQNTHRSLSIDEFRAFTLIDDYAPLVFINNKDTEGGKIFSLLHEVVHIWLGLHSFFNDNSGIVFDISPLEIICNAVAAELQVPNAHFINEWNNQSNLAIDEKIDNIAKHFRCGSITIARRALDNKYINQSQYEKIVADLTANSKKRKDNQGGGDYYNTAKSRYGVPFILALDNSIKEGKTTYTEAFRLTNTNRKTFDTLVEEITSIKK
ncbi:MAG: ImmA/IrrE family metallo-endopeptidase [Treponema sp.]|jgi:Zn-dependent peptidase ImmA (M78 family)|nr:ImmA/IrrE family metallo-endopeptidase [Treponema sp.]